MKDTNLNQINGEIDVLVVENILLIFGGGLVKLIIKNACSLT